MIITYASIFMIANLLDPDSVEEDPRSVNFGKLRIWGNWVDITGGMGQIVTLVSRLLPTRHNGEWAFWTKNKAGVYKKLGAEEFGGQDAFDVLVQFLEGKLSPIAKTVSTIWKQQDFQGEKPTPESIATSLIIPIPAQNIPQLAKSPESSFIIGSVILDLLGFSTSSTVMPNTVSKALPVDKNLTNKDILDYVAAYSDAMDQNPERVFNSIFSGQYILEVDDTTAKIIAMPENEKTPEDETRIRLDLTIPEELGGKIERDNMSLVSVGKFNRYSYIEKILIKAVEDKKLTQEEAVAELKDFKDGTVGERYLRELYE
jgi:hypothetical protein